MYLRHLYVQNNGPIRKLNIEIPFKTEGALRPLVLVGENGSGKTNLLSIIADALFEAATIHYTDVIPSHSSSNRPWFRVVGAPTITAGTKGSCTLLQFEHDKKNYVYKEKGGALSAEETRPQLPDVLKPHASWPDQGSVKEFEISDEDSKNIFEQGIYIYFPSNRAEIPHWLNRNSLPADEFDLIPRYVKLLQKPIYVERGLQQLKQWILSVLIDIRIDFPVAMTKDEISIAMANASLHLVVWQALNRILQTILNDASARLVWAGRRSYGKIGFVRNGVSAALPLDALSAGQATLLNIFGTLLRYGDAIGSVQTPEQIAGICIIDEIDAHMHIDLQYRALPKLMQIFPNVQFLVSSHSPLFLLGMESTFGAGSTEIIEMPSGRSVQVEAYSEFGRAMEVIQETKAFNQALLDAAGSPGKLLVLLEGETDPIYFTAAAKLLERQYILEEVEFSWVGAKDAKTGEGFHTGKGALNTTYAVLRAKPELVKRPVLLLYDNDAKKTPENQGHVYIRSIPDNSSNSVIKNGIENLLPTAVITRDMFDEKTIDKGNGSTIITRNLNKMKLCKHLCETKHDPSDFIGFSPVLDLLESIYTAGTTNPIAQVSQETLDGEVS